MDLREIPLFSMITRQMNWLTARQKVLAQNIANADTPNYIPKDLVPLDFAKLAREAGDKLTLRTTSGQHIRGGLTPNGRIKSEEAGDPVTTPSGNAVVLEEQMFKASETQADFELITRLYRKHVGLLRSALGRRN